MKPDAEFAESLAEHTATVSAHRHHGITTGRAGHDEVCAARAEAAAFRRGMTDDEISDAMGFGRHGYSALAEHCWITPQNTFPRI